jgi:hypothetical protein
MRYLKLGFRGLKACRLHYMKKNERRLAKYAKK